MPRIHQYTEYLDSEEGGEEKHKLIVELPPQDWTSHIHIDFQPSDFVQLNKDSDGHWHLVTSLPEVKTAQKKVRQTTARKP